MKDNLIICPKCNGNACYETKQSPVLTMYTCMGCGFTTNSLLKKDSEVYNEYIQEIPELYKDLAYTDTENKVWFPVVMNSPTKGIVFVNGTNLTDWQWAGLLAVPISDNEKDKFPKETTHKSDMKSMKFFGKNGFMDAMEYAGFFDENK